MIFNVFLARVIPEVLVPHEISGHAVGEVIVASDMHERKAEMARRADAFIALPGMQLLLFVFSAKMIKLRTIPT